MSHFALPCISSCILVHTSGAGNCHLSPACLEATLLLVSSEQIMHRFPQDAPPIIASASQLSNNMRNLHQFWEAVGVHWTWLVTVTLGPRISSGYRASRVSASARRTGRYTTHYLVCIFQVFRCLRGVGITMEADNWWANIFQLSVKWKLSKTFLMAQNINLFAEQDYKKLWKFPLKDTFLSEIWASYIKREASL